jgi:hypothetical protein
VTAHRPLGTGALVALAIWVAGVSFALGSLARAASGVGADVGGLLAYGYIDTAGRFVFAVIAVVQIARIEAIRRPWRWAPAWVLGIVAVEWLVEALLGTVAGQAALPYYSLGLGGLVQTGGTLVLGLLAIALGAGVLRQRGGTPGAPSADRAD